MLAVCVRGSIDIFRANYGMPNFVFRQYPETPLDRGIDGGLAYTRPMAKPSAEVAAGAKRPLPPGHEETPYLDALLAYAERDPGRLHVPGHKGGAGADPGLIEALGERALTLDIPALTPGIDVGPEPTPFQRAQ